MAIECYQTDCPHHSCHSCSDDGPYCHEGRCLMQLGDEGGPEGETKVCARRGDESSCLSGTKEVTA